MAHVPTKAAHQFHGGGRQKRRLCTRLLGDIQAELEHNQRIIADFGKQQGNASWQDGEFKAANGVKFLACGRGQSPRGLRDREARPDYIVIDDLDDDELCRNEETGA